MTTRIAWISAATLFLLVVVGLITFNFWIRSYLAGDAFRTLLNEQTGIALQARAEFAPLRWTGSSVFSGEFQAEGLPGSPLDSLTANQIRAEVNWRAIFGGAWTVDRIDVARADARLQFDSPAVDASAPPAQMHAATDPPAASLPDPSSPAGVGLPSVFPTRFELGELSVQDANVDLSNGFDIRNAPLKMRPEGEGWVIDVSGGKLTMPDRPALSIDAVRLRLQKESVFLTEANLRSEGAGKITLSGEFGAAASGASRLFVTWSDLPSNEVFEKGWTDNLNGTLAGDAEVTFPMPGQMAARGKFHLRDGHLTGLPMQSEIARFTRSPQFDRIPVHEFSADFIRGADTTEFSKVVFESKGLMRVEGDCRVDDDTRIDGTFQVGVTPQTLQWLPGSQEKVFTESRDGYLWTDLVVTGTLENPKENLSSRLARAVGEQVIESGGELLENVPAETKDAVRDIIDTLVPLFR